MMPLYLFDEHWAIARRKMAPILGFMCTLDIMGYTQEQLAVIPFLVLTKALEKFREDPSESNGKMLMMIELTCQKMLEQNTKLTDLVIEQVIAFAYQPDGVSTRTADVVKSVTVLAGQFYCILQMPNFKLLVDRLSPDSQAKLVDEAALTDLKKRLLRFGLEEQNRRTMTEKAEAVVSNILTLLTEGHEHFVESIWTRKAKQIDRQMNSG